MTSLSFDPGEADQFDRSHQTGLIGGATTTVEVAYPRLESLPRKNGNRDVRLFPVAT